MIRCCSGGPLDLPFFQITVDFKDVSESGPTHEPTAPFAKLPGTPGRHSESAGHNRWDHWCAKATRGPQATGPQAGQGRPGQQPPRHLQVPPTCSLTLGTR